MKNSDKFIPQGVQPYKNMPARKGVLICGLVFTLISFILMLVAVLFLFVPDVKMGGNVSPSLMLSVIWASASLWGLQARCLRSRAQT